jgi:hypothetical protein
VALWGFGKERIIYFINEEKHSALSHWVKKLARLIKPTLH